MFNQINLKSALKDNLLKYSKNSISYKKVVIDSRTISKDDLFIALIGDNNDAHNYLKQVFENGAKYAIVQKIPDEFKNDNRLILVKDTNKALTHLAIDKRANFKGKIIAITGSVGKTSIKEMLKTVIGFKNKVCANLGNLNNHIGLPLSLSNLDENCDYGIFEMGMNHLREIEFLTNIAKPDIAIISNISKAHIGNFKNEDEIALAKSEILLGVKKDGYAILNKDDKYFDFLKSQAIKSDIREINILTFGQDEQSDIQLKSFKSTNFESQINVKINNEEINYKINSSNEIVAKNSLIAISCLKVLKVEIDDYLPAFNNLQTPKGRGNIIKINKDNKNLTIIDDSYNANLTSMIAGLNFLSQLGKQNPNSRTVAIIGDMLELGKESENEHKKIAKHINEFNINKVLLVGDLTQNIISELDDGKIISHENIITNLIPKISNIVQNNDIILIKGSNGMNMNKIIAALQ